MVGSRPRTAGCRHLSDLVHETRWPPRTRAVPPDPPPRRGWAPSSPRAGGDPAARDPSACSRRLPPPRPLAALPSLFWVVPRKNVQAWWPRPRAPSLTLPRSPNAQPVSGRDRLLSSAARPDPRDGAAANVRGGGSGPRPAPPGPCAAGRSVHGPDPALAASEQLAPSSRASGLSLHPIFSTCFLHGDWASRHPSLQGEGSAPSSENADGFPGAPGNRPLRLWGRGGSGGPGAHRAPSIDPAISGERRPPPPRCSLGQ